MSVPSATHLLLIPSYNTGAKVLETVRDACRFWNPVWVVIDGSTDGTREQLEAMAAGDPGLRVMTLPFNQGKGAAVLHGLTEAQVRGYTHVLTMDADGQHPADKIGEFMAASQAHPRAMILGRPVFDASAPAIRVAGRKLSNGWTHLQTLNAGIGDSLFGFRVYPIAPLRKIMERTPWMRRFDFDPEAAVRLCWAGVEPINIDAKVRYFRPEEGGVSHFNYVRDNILLSSMHGRLLFEFFLYRLPLMLWARTFRTRSSPR
jgi:glycosyltransferase involved in cell wall biosynthesis